MTSQPDLFGGGDGGMKPTVNVPSDSQDGPRITGTSREFLRELLRGPCSEEQLKGMSDKYKSLIGYLRRKGYDIRERKLESGLVFYYLVQGEK